jgi:hypothetical protein
MPKHIYFESKDISPDDHWGQLNIVDGGLALCKVCGGLEGGLPTDCPGEKMSWDSSQEVYEGKKDFLDKQGWVQQASTNSPVYYAELSKQYRNQRS